MKKTLFVLLFILLACPGFGKKLAVLSEFNRPNSMAVDQDQLYVVEGTTIFIYSLKDYRPLSKFGKPGEGPKEFTAIPGAGVILSPRRDDLIVNSLGKVSHYTKDGKFISEIMTKATFMSYYQPTPKGYIGLGFQLNQKDRSSFITLNLYDEKLNKLKEIYRQKGLQRGRLEFPSVPPIFYILGDKIVMPGQEDLSINVYNLEGEKISSFKKKYTPLKVTQEYKDMVLHFFKTNPATKAQYEFLKNIITFPDYFPPIQSMLTANEKLYVLTYRQKNGKFEFLVFNIKGKFLKQVFLPFGYMNGIMPLPTAIRDNTFYHLVENEETEQWELYGEKIE